MVAIPQVGRRKVNAHFASVSVAQDCFGTGGNCFNRLRFNNAITDIIDQLCHLGAEARYLAVKSGSLIQSLS